MVGMVLVSHSPAVAEGTAELVRQMAGEVEIAAVGGDSDGYLGTDPEEIQNAIEGIEADGERCAESLASTLGLATVLNPVVGYHEASEVAREAAATGKSVREVILEKKILSEEELDKLLKDSVGD